jgi:hypothetical protein
MTKLDNPLWRIKTSLLIYFTRDFMNVIVYIIAAFVTIAPYFSNTHWVVSFMFTCLFLGYNARCYTLGRLYLANVILGGVANDVAPWAVVRLLKKPVEFAYELKLLHDKGRSL